MNTNTYTNNSATNPERKKFVESVASKNYQGPSVVDYLTSSGYDASQNSRAGLAQDYGVQNYDFSSGKNQELMTKLRGGSQVDNSQSNTTTTNTTTATKPTAFDPDFQTYLDSLNETTEEKGAREYVSRLLSDSKIAHEKALNSGETMGYAQGEAARVKRNNDLTIDSASGAYDVLKTGEEKKRGVAKLKYDYYKGQKEKEEKVNAPFELSEGQSRYVYNPEKKTYEAIAVQPKTYKPTSNTPKIPKPTQTQTRNADVSTVVDTLEKVKKAKGQYGVDPTSYQYYLDQIIKNYGSTGANELTKQLKAKGLTVDNAQDKKNYK